MDALIGAAVADGYTLRRRLGRRGSHEVYEAEAADGTFRVAEVLLGGHAPSDDALARYRDEVAAVGRLGGPHVARVHSVGRLDDGGVYTLLDYLDGEDLATRLEREGALRWQDARAILFGAADALSTVHAAGKVHGRLEPASIFLMRRPAGEIRPVLLHFGVSHLEGDGAAVDMRDTGGYPRQSAYDAPEKIHGAPVDARSDLYSLASILFEMIAGAPPFTGPNGPAVLARVLTEAPPALAAQARQPFPSGLDAILARALAKEPAERFESVELFAKKVQSTEALHSWTWPEGADGTAPFRHPTGESDPSPKPRARGAIGLTLAVAIAVAALVVALSLILR